MEFNKDYSELRLNTINDKEYTEICTEIFTFKKTMLDKNKTYFRKLT